MKSLLHKSLWGLLYLLPAVLFFSYYPVITLGATTSMNLELSLPLIWLVLFDLVAFLTLLTLPKTSSKNSPNPKSSRRQKPQTTRNSLAVNLPGISDRRIFLFSLLPFYLTLSVFWSKNPLRGLLTAGIVWLLFFAIFAILFLLPLLKSPKNLKTRLLLSLFISTAVVCVFCFIQSILDTCGLPRTETLLCAGCTYRSFGFPHPSGFAIEPQFMGNLLLAPTLTALYLLVFRTTKPARRTFLTLAAVLFSTTLFFTFSRGAIYAYALALLVLFIFALVRHKLRPALVVIPVATFLLSLGLQGTFAHFGPTSETFTSAVTKSIHQLSLGLVDLRSLAKEAKTTESSIQTDLKDVEDDLQPPKDLQDITHDLEQETARFEGYVAESTNVRLSLNSVALATALQSPQAFIFGVGLGGAGAAMFEAFPDKVGSPKEIVQNETFSLLLETGLIGLFFVHFTLILIFLAPLLPAWFIDGRAAKTAKNPALSAKIQKPTQTALATSSQPFLRRKFALLKASPFWSHPALPLISALLLAYLVTLSFFSGLPNALQIYLMPPLLFFIFRLPDSPKCSSDSPLNPQKISKIPENSCKSHKSAL